MAKILYIGSFLTTESKALLLAWWKLNVGDLLSDVKAEHVTLKFKPNDLDLSLYPMKELGKLENKIKVIGYAKNDKCQAVHVACELKSNNEFPHITIAVNGVPPSYSNELISNAVKDGTLIKVDGPELIGIFDSFPRSK
jgi:hypothetical protein